MDGGVQSNLWIPDMNKTTVDGMQVGRIPEKMSCIGRVCMEKLELLPMQTYF
ncbi:MAG: hypothetical protein HW380_2581 [Magnetococcales bacterium]|nr:hypothetical protein [Magnetococcales bacterium]